jgi:hypothetical protein
LKEDSTFKKLLAVEKKQRACGQRGNTILYRIQFQV